MHADDADTCNSNHSLEIQIDNKLINWNSVGTNSCQTLIIDRNNRFVTRIFYCILLFAEVLAMLPVDAHSITHFFVPIKISKNKNRHARKGKFGVNYHMS